MNNDQKNKDKDMRSDNRFAINESFNILDDDNNLQASSLIESDIHLEQTVS